MNLYFVSRRFRSLNVPSAFLLAFLQRTPVVRVMAFVESAFVSSPAANVVRSVFTAAAALGAIDSMAGATDLQTTPPAARTNFTAAVGQAVSVFFGVAPTDTPPASWTVTSTNFPQGLDFSGLTAPGSVNVTNLHMEGAATTPGTYTVGLTAYEFPNEGGISSQQYQYTITITGASNMPPSITTQPSSQSVSVGANATFSVAASGTPTPTYQWRKDGVAIAGATGTSLPLSNVQTSDAGTYTVVVTNSVSSATSTGAVLTVSPAATAPTFTQQPAPQTVSVGASATFSVTAAGSPTPTYQWQKDGSPLNGQTSATLTLANVSAADAGTYTVVITNSVSSATSAGAVLTISAAAAGAPTFTQQPLNQAVVPGSTVTLSAAVSASSAASYQWMKNGVAVVNGGTVSGATTPTLAIANAGAGDVANYTLVATNSGGSTTSSVAAVTLGDASNFGRIINMSVLTSIDASETLTFGYFLGGDGVTGTKPILMRAMGPSLASLLPNTLPDPFIEFYNGTTKVSENDNWGGDAGIQSAVTAVQAFPFTATTSSDAAIYGSAVSLDSGHSIKVSARGGQGGSVLAELYDATPSDQFTTKTPRLINVSLLKNVGDLTSVGFFINGSTNVKVLIRAVGPSLALAPFGIGGVMPDPTMDLIPLGSSTVVATNDDWGGTADLKAAFTTVNAFGIPDTSKDAVLLISLPPGGYSVQVRPKVTNQSGLAIIEVYEIR